MSAKVNDGLSGRERRFADLLVAGVDPVLAFGRAGFVLRKVPGDGGLPSGEARGDGPGGGEDGGGGFVREADAVDWVAVESGVAAGKLMAKPAVRRYVRARRKAVSEAGRWQKWQLLDFLQAVLETPVCDVDERSVLAEEFSAEPVGGARATKAKREPVKGSRGKAAADAGGCVDPEDSPALPQDEVAVRRKVKMFGKKEAAVMLAQLMGWKAPVKKEDGGEKERLAEFLERLRRGERREEEVGSEQ